MKKSKLLLSSAILSTLYTFHIISLFLDVPSDDVAYAVGVALAGALIVPHALMVALGVIFNWIGWANNKPWAALTAGILYSVSIILMIPFIQNVILQTIFSFVGYAKIKKAIAQNADTNSSNNVN